MGLGSFLSRTPSRKSREPSIYYYNTPSYPSPANDRESVYSGSGQSAAYLAANAASNVSRSSSMTGLSGSAAAAALKRHSSQTSLQYVPQLQNTAAARAAGRTMSLSSRSFRTPDRSTPRRSNSFQPGQFNPYIKQQQQQSQQKIPLSRASSMTSNTYRPSISKANSLTSNSSRFTGTTTTTTTTTTKRAPNNSRQPVTTIVKTTKEKDAEGRTKSITKTTIERKGDVEIVKTTVIKPTPVKQYAGSILSDTGTEQFDDDFYQAYDEDPMLVQEIEPAPVIDAFIEEPQLEQIAEEDPNMTYTEDVYDSYISEAKAPVSAPPVQQTPKTTQQKREAAMKAESIPTNTVVEPEIQPETPPVESPQAISMQQEPAFHSYRRLTEAVRAPSKPASERSASSPVRSILKNTINSNTTSPMEYPQLSTQNGRKKVVKTVLNYEGDDPVESDATSVYSDAVQDVPTSLKRVNNAPADNIDHEKVTEDIQSNASSTVQHSPQVTQRGAFKSPQLEQYHSQNGQNLQPPFNPQQRSNSLTSTTSSSIKKQVKIAPTVPSETYQKQSTPRRSPVIPKKAQQTPEEMYAIAFQLAQQKVYGERQLQPQQLQQQQLQQKQLQEQQMLMEQHRQNEMHDNETSDNEFDKGTQKNTAMNANGGRTFSLTDNIRRSFFSKPTNGGRTMSMTSSLNPSLNSSNTVGGYKYESNAAGSGFKTHSLRENFPDSKELKKQKKLQNKEEEKKRKQFAKEQNNEVKRLSKQRESAVLQVKEEQIMKQELPQADRPQINSLSQPKTKTPQSPIPATPSTPPTDRLNGGFQSQELTYQQPVQQQAQLPVEQPVQDLQTQPQPMSTPVKAQAQSQPSYASSQRRGSFPSQPTNSSIASGSVKSSKKKKFGIFSRSNKDKQSKEGREKVSQSSSPVKKRDSITVAIPDQQTGSSPSIPLPPSLSSNPNSNTFVNEANLRDQERRRESLQQGNRTNSANTDDIQKVKKFMKFFNL